MLIKPVFIIPMENSVKISTFSIISESMTENAQVSGKLKYKGMILLQSWNSQFLSCVESKFKQAQDSAIALFSQFVVTSP